MKKLVVIMLSYMFFPIYALADVYSWIDAHGVKHFSNHPPTSEAHSVKVVKEFHRSDPPMETDEPKSTANNITSPATKPKKNVITTQTSPENTQQKGNNLILKEQQQLDLKLKALNQQLVDAQQARYRGSSYDYQDWTNRIEQIQSDIDSEKQQSSRRIQRIKSQYDMD